MKTMYRSRCFAMSAGFLLERLFHKQPLRSRIRRINYCSSRSRCASRRKTQRKPEPASWRSIWTAPPSLPFATETEKPNCTNNSEMCSWCFKARLRWSPEVRLPVLTSAPGEIRGASVEQGIRKKLQEGDIVAHTCGCSSSIVLDAGGAFTYFVVKIPLK